jgi:hypothetical protein
MSTEPGYDYDFEVTVRPDEDFTRSVRRDTIESFLEKLPNVARHGKGFLLDSFGRAMDLEPQFRRSDGRTGEPVEGGDQTNCVYLHIPAHARGADRDHEYFAIAFSIADHLGWLVFDDTDSGSTMSRSRSEPDPPPQKPWWKVW